MPTLLDTHAWVWWVTEDRRLSRKAAGVIQEAVRGDGVSLSMISIWGIAKKVKKKGSSGEFVGNWGAQRCG